MEDNQEIPIKIEISSVLKDNINRVWTFIKQENKIREIIEEVRSSLKGDAINTVETELGSASYENTLMTYKCVEISSMSHYKKISWEASSPSIETVLLYNFILFANTIDNSTLIVLEIRFDQPELIQFTSEVVALYKSLCADILVRIDQHLRTSAENLTEFEAIIISGSMSRIWEIITNWRKFKNVSDLIADEVEYDGNPLEMGTTLTLKFTKNQKRNVLCFLKVILVDADPQSCKWRYILECYDGKPRIPHQEIQFTLVQINEDKCYLSYIHDFKENIKPEDILSLGNDKKTILGKLKDFLEEKNVVK